MFRRGRATTSSSTARTGPPAAAAAPPPPPAGPATPPAASQQQQPKQQQRSIAAALAARTLPGARPELAAALAPHYADVVERWPGDGTLPLVYSPDYNVTLWGIEKLHPFDSCKFAKVVARLTAAGVLDGPERLVPPLPLPEAALLEVHDAAYLGRLHSSSAKVAAVSELPPLALLPHCVLSRRLLRPMRAHAAGTALAAALAATRGWAVNLGGGMHHAHSRDGSGWCPYADITLAVRRLRAASGGAVRRVVVIDLDVHQGNGVELDKLSSGDGQLFIVDVYNARAFPLDREAKAGIDVDVPLQPGTRDAEYLEAVDAALQRAAREFPRPDLVVYNAGTDVLAGDPLGRLELSPEAVVRRDAAVWAWAARQRAPIAMLLSGGYSRASAGAIVMSLESLLRGLAAGGAAG